MAVCFRHGSNGAYKSAYAVWFEIVPALRAGRLVITNVEGLKSLKGIEKALGEKFPESAQLIRIFSRSEEGVLLWQNWFSWAPIGALIIIDECQDLFTKDVGFNREKALYKPVEEFLQYLPPGFSELFYSRWLPVPEDARSNDGEEDDTGRTQYDDEGRLLYPYNFYGAFMRHRKYQWDLILLTPDWTSIPTWLRGCAQTAYSHSSKDTFFSKRRPRIFVHTPQGSKSQPTTKQDFAASTSVKIPIDVFALYKSTGTGDFNESKADITILKSPKFIFVILLMFGSLSFFVKGLYERFSSSDSNSTTQVENSSQEGSSALDDSAFTASGDTQTKASLQSDRSLADVHDSSEGRVSRMANDGRVNPFYHEFSMFDDASAVYLTEANRYVKNGRAKFVYNFRIDMGSQTYYLNSNTLSRYNYMFNQIDDCLVQVMYDTEYTLLTCPPYEAVESAPKDSMMANRNRDIPTVDGMFSL